MAEPAEPPTGWHELVMTARAGQWQSGVSLADGDYRCLRCREPVTPLDRTRPAPGTLFVCFVCVEAKRQPRDRGWYRLRGRLGLLPDEQSEDC